MPGVLCEKCLVDGCQQSHLLVQSGVLLSECVRLLPFHFQFPHYVPYVPNRYEAFILRNRKILADQMEFLLQGVPKNSRMHLAS